MTRHCNFAVRLLAVLLPAMTAVCVADQYKPDPKYAPRCNLARFFAKIRAGQPAVVMGIGGSVTEGHSWAAMSAEWLQKQYPGKPIFYVDGAYGGTPPWQTVFRMRRDILPHHPDLVFIEYAVNSYLDNQRNWLAEDGMIRQLLRQPQQPEIVFVYVGSDTGARDLEKVQPVARHYGFLEVDVRSHLQKKIDAGEVTWKAIAGDAIHPNQRGHAIYAEAVTALLGQQSLLAGKPAPPLPAPFFGDEFTTATLLPIAAAQVSPEWRAVQPPGWTGKFLDEIYQTDRPGAKMTLTANTTAIGVYLIQTTDSAPIAWSIDGGPEKREDLWAGWLGRGGLYVRNFLLATGLPRGDHVLKLTVLPKSEKAEGNLVRIGGFCVTNPKGLGIGD
ncbi:MAG: SGNH/GDSL hydrolase family protein [Thermoguttaceae bacterium]